MSFWTLKLSKLTALEAWASFRGVHVDGLREYGSYASCMSHPMHTCFQVPDRRPLLMQNCILPIAVEI